MKNLPQEITKQEPKRSRFHSKENGAREVYYHFTVATDTSNIRKVFNDVHDMILMENMNNLGLF